MFFWIGATVACAQDLSFSNRLLKESESPLAGARGSELHHMCAAIGRVATIRDWSCPAVSGRNLWLTSVTALAVANALDVHSSWGKRELNQTLAGRSGNFGGQGALLKAAFQGGLVGFECLLMRHRPSSKLNKVLSIVNFGAAAVAGGVAAHNYTIPRALP